MSMYVLRGKWETDTFSSLKKNNKKIIKKNLVIDFDLFPFYIFHSEDKCGLYNHGEDVKCNTQFINHTALDVYKRILIFITCLVTFVLPEKLFTFP